jgi:hypothetical protein
MTVRNHSVHTRSQLFVAALATAFFLAAPAGAALAHGKCHSHSAGAPPAATPPAQAPAAGGA